MIFPPPLSRAKPCRLNVFGVTTPGVKAPGVKAPGVKAPGVKTLLAGVLLVCGIAVERVGAYDSPDFDVEVFYADGIFLEENEKQSLLEALASIASNFTNNRRVDSDLREKALAISLRLDPFHRNSRAAHSALQKGLVPAETPYFDSLSAVVEQLWTTSVRLSEQPVDPEERRLSRLLMELSILMHPDPPVERLRRFASVTKGKDNEWKRFVLLQPEDNPSTMRSRDLMREIGDILKETPVEPPVSPGAKKPTETPMVVKSPPVADSPEKPDPPKKVEPVVRSISTVRFVTAVDSQPVPGVFQLEIRPPEGNIELEIFPFVRRPEVSQYPQVPVLPSRRGVTVNEVAIPMASAIERGWDWKEGFVAEVAFDPGEEALPGPRRICRTRGLLPTIILLESALTGKEINDAVVVAGDVNPDTFVPNLEGAVIPVIQAAKKSGRRFLVLPESALATLVEELQVNPELSLLFEMEIISYATMAEAVSFATREAGPELTAAMDAFAAVKAVSDKMPLVDFARNVNVHERLVDILEGYPKYASARAMLAFGTAPVSEKAKIVASVKMIDQWIEPFLEMDGSFDFNELRNRIEETERELSRIRTEIHPDTRDYHSAAEDLLEAAERYLSLTNLTTSIADQRLREAENAVGEARAERELIAVPQ